MGCAEVRREYIWSQDVSIFLYRLRRKAAIQPTLLILVPADLEQSWMPVSVTNLL